MPTRTSIELSDEVCRVLQVEVGAGSAAETGGAGAWIKAFRSDLPGASDPHSLVQALRRFRRVRSLPRDAVVTAWGLGVVHRWLRLADGPDLEGRARAEVADDLALLERRGGRALLVVLPGPPVPGTGEREVSLLAVPESSLAIGLEIVTDAGFQVRRIVPPSLALVALAGRQREAGAVVAYVAMAARGTCIAVIRDGSLLLARELDWGYGHESDGNAMAAHLAGELRRSMLYVHQMFRTPVGTVVVCGDTPSLRSAVGPLGPLLGVPVQTLDSLAGIDVERAPEPAEAFRAQIAALRVAIAAGAEPEPFPTFGHEAAQTIHRSRLARVTAAVLAGVAVLVLGLLARSLLFQARREQPPPEAGAATAPAGARSPESARGADVADARGAVSGGPARSGTPPTPDLEPDRSVTVTTILFSANRRLAIIDGRVVGVGDRVGPNVVFDIRPRAVILEGPDGRRWTAPLEEAR